MLEKYDLLPRFLFLLTAEDIELGKPNPQIYHRSAAKLDIEISEMMVLEDSSNGCQSAVSSGSYAVAVRANHNQHLAFPGAALIADSLGDPRILNAFPVAQE